MIRRAPNRATSSRTSLSSRPEPNNASISPRIFSVGDTRDGTGVVLPVQTLAVLYGTYARRHLHRLMDTTSHRDAVRPATVVLKRLRPPLAQVELILRMGEGEIRTNQPIDVVEPVALNLAAQRRGHQPPLAALPDQTVRLNDQGAHPG